VRTDRGGYRTTATLAPFVIDLLIGCSLILLAVRFRGIIHARWVWAPRGERAMNPARDKGEKVKGLATLMKPTSSRSLYDDLNIILGNWSINMKSVPEEFLAELTDAAYRVALRHGIKGSFVEVELGLWEALRAEFVKQRNPRAQHGGWSE
jgi:hypothetical protein